MNEFNAEGLPDSGMQPKESPKAAFDLKALGERLKKEAVKMIEEALIRATQEAERDLEIAKRKYEDQLVRIEEEKAKGTDAKAIEYAEKGAREIFENSIRDIEKNIKDSLKI